MICALAFCVLFSAYNTLQNYATSLFPGNLANVSLALLYAVAGVSVFAAPALTAQLGEKATMILGACCYVVYLVSLLWLESSPSIVIFTSIVIGFGAAVLWVALGSFLTTNSTAATYASNTGLFWSIFQVNNVVGNLTTWAVISTLTSSTNTLYLGFAAVAGAGTLVLFLLQQPPAPPPAAATLGEHLAGAAAGARRALRLLGDPRMLLLLPLFFFSGAELSFWTGEFPLLLQNGSMGEVGFVLAWAGGGEIAGGALLGRLSDAAGRTPSLLLAVALYGAALALTCAMKSGAPAAAAAWRGAPVAAYAAAFLFGAADAGFNANAVSFDAPLRAKNPAPKKQTRTRTLHPLNPNQTVRHVLAAVRAGHRARGGNRGGGGGGGGGGGRAAAPAGRARPRRQRGGGGARAVAQPACLRGRVFYFPARAESWLCAVVRGVRVAACAQRPHQGPHRHFCSNLGPIGAAGCGGGLLCRG
jgi:MFS family permease